MARSIRKAVADYDKATRKGRYGAFYCSDFEEIKELATQNGGISFFEAVDIALKAGFMIGYRTAKRHDRQKKGK